jgi:hypothetical protein
MKIYRLNEQNMWDLKKELKHFHSVLDIDVTIKDLMKSLGGINMDINTIFPILKGDETLKEISGYKPFLSELKEYKLKLSELFDTKELQTFSKLPMKWYWIRTEDSTDLDTPIYIMYKYYYDKKWSDIKLYYIQEDITKFLDKLSTITIEFRTNDNKRWFYKTSNSGVNWDLEKDTKKIKEDGKYIEVHSENETATFKPHIKWADVLSFSSRTDLELYIY